jgi:hypothetical protein
MQKIDRLGWADGISVYAYGLRIGVRLNKPGHRDAVIARLPPGWELGCSPLVDQLFSFKVGGQGVQSNLRQYHLVFGGLTRLARTMDLDEALDALQEALEQAVAHGAKNRVFMHAGVVGWRGRAIVLPGRTFAGKSTLVAALLRAGATYYSDEFAVFDGDGHVHPFARPLAMRKENGLRDGRYTPEQLGSHAGDMPLPVGVVAFLEYRAGVTPRLRPLSPGQTALELVRYCYRAEEEPEMALFTVQRAVEDAACLKGVRGEADAMAAQLLRAVESGAINDDAPALAA